MAKLISVEMAHDMIANAARPLPITSVGLKHSLGHVLASDVRANVTLPPLDASAMDGYAVNLESHHVQGSSFKLIGQSPAGAPYGGTVSSGEAVRIFTGGAVPKGANHVIMQENISADGNIITLTEPISKANHIRQAGIDFKNGEVLLNKGTKLGAYELALLAAANCARIPVIFAPKIALIANGDELVEPGGQAVTGKVISSNPYGLAPLLNSWGANTVNMGISKDDPNAIAMQIQKAITKGVDVLVPIGGASVGDRDFMRSVFTSKGYKKHFEKVAVKPGKPVWFGMLGPRYVLGLPGNPASALVTAHVFLKPLIAALTGDVAAPHSLITARTTQDLPASTWRSEYIRANAKTDENGQIQVTPYPRQDSSLIIPFVTANCFIVRDAGTPAKNAGDRVQIYLIKPLN